MRYKLVIEYDGTPFVGWQRQKDGISVQEVLEKALSTAVREPIVLFGSGRTDTGVHALAQVAHFDTEKKLDCFRLRESLNALVRPYPISIHLAEPVSEDFHATRFPPALDKNRVWWYSYPLDVQKMDEAAQLLLGKHDFSTFRASECQAKSPVKTLDFIEVKTVSSNIIEMTVRARSFLHHQVRNIMGSLVNVGSGKWTVSDFKKALEAKDRRAGGQTAPAAGLYFVSVRYE